MADSRVVEPLEITEGGNYGSGTNSHNTYIVKDGLTDHVGIHDANMNTGMQAIDKITSDSYIIEDLSDAYVQIMDSGWIYGGEEINTPNDTLYIKSAPNGYTIFFDVFSTGAIQEAIDMSDDPSNPEWNGFSDRTYIYDNNDPKIGTNDAKGIELFSMAIDPGTGECYGKSLMETFRIGDNLIDVSKLTQIQSRVKAWLDNMYNTTHSYNYWTVGSFQTMGSSKGTEEATAAERAELMKVYRGEEVTIGNTHYDAISLTKDRGLTDIYSANQLTFTKSGNDLVISHGTESETKTGFFADPLNTTVTTFDSESKIYEINEVADLNMTYDFEPGCGDVHITLGDRQAILNFGETDSKYYATIDADNGKLTIERDTIVSGITVVDKVIIDDYFAGDDKDNGKGKVFFDNIDTPLESKFEAPIKTGSLAEYNVLYVNTKTLSEAGTYNGTFIADSFRNTSVNVDVEVNSGEGDDYIYLTKGNNTVNAGAGDDYIYLSTGNHTVNAGEGDDNVTATPSTGTSAIRLGLGNDIVLIPGWAQSEGHVEIYGEGGNDTFKIGGGMHGKAVIKDATSDDKIVAAYNANYPSFEDYSFTRSNDNLEIRIDKEGATGSTIVENFFSTPTPIDRFQILASDSKIAYDKSILDDATINVEITQAGEYSASDYKEAYTIASGIAGNVIIHNLDGQKDSITLNGVDFDDITFLHRDGRLDMAYGNTLVLLAGYDSAANKLSSITTSDGTYGFAVGNDATEFTFSTESTGNNIIIGALDGDNLNFTDINANNVRYTRNAYGDLVVTVEEQAGFAVTLKGFFSADVHKYAHLDTIKFNNSADVSILDDAEINVNADSYFLGYNVVNDAATAEVGGYKEIINVTSGNLSTINIDDDVLNAISSGDITKTHDDAGYHYTLALGKDKELASIIVGQLGDDTIYDSEGNDYLAGANGVDKIYSTKGEDALIGGAGADYLYAKNNTSAVEIYGGEGADEINSGSGDDFIWGGSGNDEIHLNGGNNRIILSDVDFGSDTIYGATANDKLEFVLRKGGEVVQGHAFNELTFVRNNADLEIFVGNNGSKATISGFFTAESPVDTILTADRTEAHSIKNEVVFDVELVDGQAWDKTTAGYEGYKVNLSLADGATGVTISGLGNDDTLNIDGELSYTYHDDLGVVISSDTNDVTINDFWVPNSQYADYEQKVFILKNGENIVDFENETLVVDYSKAEESAKFRGLSRPGFGTYDITGSDYADKLTGGRDTNIIKGGDGDDEINAIGDNNTLTGGDGNDTFDVLLGSIATITDAKEGDSIALGLWGTWDDVTANKNAFVKSGNDLIINGPMHNDKESKVIVQNFFSNASKVDTVKTFDSLESEGYAEHSIKNEAVINIGLANNEDWDKEEAGLTGYTVKASLLLGATHASVTKLEDGDELVTTTETHKRSGDDLVLDAITVKNYYTSGDMSVDGRYEGVIVGTGTLGALVVTDIENVSYFDSGSWETDLDETVNLTTGLTTGTSQKPTINPAKLSADTEGRVAPNTQDGKYHYTSYRTGDPTDVAIDGAFALARDGADTVYGTEGNDWIHGGAGNDTIYGGTAGHDMLAGGDEVIAGTTGENTIYAAGVVDNELVYNTDGVEIYGGKNKDTIYAGGNVDTQNYIWAHGGNDEIHLNGGKNTIMLAEDDNSDKGNDTIYGATASDTLKFVSDLGGGHFAGHKFSDLRFNKVGDNLVIGIANGGLVYNTTTIVDYFKAGSRVDAIKALNEAGNEIQEYSIQDNVVIHIHLKGETFNKSESVLSGWKVAVDGYGTVVGLESGDTVAVADDATFSRDYLIVNPGLEPKYNTDLVINYGEHSWTVKDYFTDGNNQMSFVDSNGVVDLESKTLNVNTDPLATATGVDYNAETERYEFGVIRFTGTANADTYTGDDDDSIITGGKGNDTLKGNLGGKNTFIFNDGDGFDSIHGAKAGDIIQLNDVGAIVTDPEQNPNFVKNGEDLIIYHGTGETKDQIQIKDYFAKAAGARVSTYILSDGNPHEFVYVDKDIPEDDIQKNNGKVVIPNDPAVQGDVAIDATEYESTSTKGINVSNTKNKEVSLDVKGSIYNDTVNAKYGNNTVVEELGTNKITTGAGADVVKAENYSSNTINVGDGENIVYLNSVGTNKVTAGKNNNSIAATAGSNNIKLGNGANQVALTGGVNTLSTGKGDNAIILDGGVNKVTTGAGMDEYIISGGNNNVKSGNGIDKFEISDGYNTINTGNGGKETVGTMTITTGDKVDILGGTNVITSGKHDDTYVISGGNNNITSGSGADEFFIGYEAGDDFVEKTESVTGGVNAINAGSGVDTFHINSGASVLNGAAGNDTYKVNMTEFDFTNPDNSILITDTSGKNVLDLTMGDEKLNLFFDVSLKTKTKSGTTTVVMKGNNAQYTYSSMVFTTDSNPVISTGAASQGFDEVDGIGVSNNKVITKVTGTISDVDFSQRTTKNELAALAQEVANFLVSDPTKGYLSTDDVFKGGDATDIAALVNKYVAFSNSHFNS